MIILVKAKTAVLVTVDLGSLPQKKLIFKISSLPLKVCDAFWPGNEAQFDVELASVVDVCFHLK